MRITRAPLAACVAALGLAACKDNGPNGNDRLIELQVGHSALRTAENAATLEVRGGGEYVLIPFHGSQTPSSNAALEFTGTQIGAVTGPPTPEIGPESAPLLSRAMTTEALSAAARFHGEMRRIERQVLGPKLAALRASRSGARSGRLSPLGAVASSAPVPSVNDQVSLNTARTPACTGGDFRAGRVVAVTERAVIVADNNNPPGFTDAEYLQIAQEFDAIVYPTVTANFSVPGRDLDQNGERSVIFYTRAVNELTPAGSDAVVGGFFHPRDLFPKTSTDPDFACASSNEAEMFYMLVPDELGVVNGNVRTKASVRRGTVGVLAHEFQHLINASRRIYVNDATSFEEVWLNEGLSHIAEELVFYRASGLAPKQNIQLATLRSSQTILDAVNAYQVSNFGRLIEYLEEPEQRTPFANDDELATRGATWSLLRYAADRSPTPQQQIWTALVNSRNAGITNFNAVFSNVGTFINVVRDWAVANYTDDAVLTPETTFRHPSWNFRDILPAIRTPAVYPLRTRTLTAGTQLPLTLKGGSAAYIRFSVPGNATGTINVTSSGSSTLPTAVSFTVVRTK